MLIGFKQYWRVPIIEGEKTQTIRGRSCEPGTKLTLSTGVRTRHYERIGTAVCEECIPIRITADKESPLHIRGTFGWLEASVNEAKLIATRDGFVSFEQLHGYFWAMHGFPWEGFAIRWKDFQI